MQNDMLKNNIAPWQEKGRWYHAHITETGLDQVNSDDFCINNMEFQTNTQYMRLLTTDYTMIDYIMIFNDIDTSSTRTWNKGLALTTDKKTQAIGVRPDQFTKLDADVYFFINKK